MAGFDERTVATDADYLQAYDHGAHVTRWTHRGVPVVWVSEASRYEEGTAIRGGIPVCWPWFAAGPRGDRSPSHGLARTRSWRLMAHEDTLLRWRLTHEDLDDDARAPFDAEFACTLTARLEPGCLEVSLEVSNTGGLELTYEAALHTYLHVGDVREISIEGLDGVAFYDKVQQREQTQAGAVRVGGAEDRVYSSPGPTRVLDPGLEREVHVSNTGAANTVIWNPGPDGAAGMDDFGDEEWTQMVCVEAACVGSSAITLSAGQDHVMTSRIELHA